MDFSHLPPEERVFEEWNAGMPVFHICAFYMHQHALKIAKDQADARARDRRRLGLRWAA